jgi:Protein of unknown function (DUF3592)
LHSPKVDFYLSVAIPTLWLNLFYTCSMQSHYFALLIMLVGAYYAYRALQQVLTNRRFRRTGQLAEGTVRHYVRQGDEDSSTYRLEVEFTTAAQERVTAQQTLTSFTLRLAEGQAVSLRYDPRDPHQFRLTAASMERNTWVNAALAAACFGAAWFAFQAKV